MGDPTMERQRDLFAVAIYDCAVIAGIVSEGLVLTGPELLLIADDLKGYIKMSKKSVMPYKCIACAHEYAADGDNEDCPECNCYGTIKDKS